MPFLWTKLRHLLAKQFLVGFLGQLYVHSRGLNALRLINLYLVTNKLWLQIIKDLIVWPKFLSN